MLLDNPPVTLDDWYKWTKQVNNTYKKTQRMLGQVPEKIETKMNQRRDGVFPEKTQTPWILIP